MAQLSKAVDKATDATLLSDNWQYILDVCDKVSEEPEEGSRQVIQLIEKKLHQRDANVQLRTLSLLTSIAENCGSRVKQEIASKSFTNILLNKLKEPTVHKEIKVKIVQVLTQLSSSFQNDPSLKPIQDAYREVSKNYSQYFPPDKPQKFNLDNDRLKEEEDLKAAIALSLAENNQASIPTTQDIQQQQAQTTGQQTTSTIATEQSFSRVRALYDSFSQDPADLHFRKGDIITVLDRVYKDWGKGSLRGSIGLFPFNYVTPLYDPTPEELVTESAKEAQILSQARQVEKLLALLSTNGGVDVVGSEEFQKLYQEIALMKPELGGLIEKYRVRRDELLDLHGKLKDATVKYEELTDPLKKQHQQQQQQQQFGFQQPGYQQYGYQQPQPYPQPQRQNLPPQSTGAQFPLQQSVTGSNQQPNTIPTPTSQQAPYTYQQGPPPTTFQTQPTSSFQPHGSSGSIPTGYNQRHSYASVDGTSVGSPVVQQQQQQHNTGERAPYPSY